jgi:outer membrane lipoprotein-sorting protein
MKLTEINKKMKKIILYTIAVMYSFTLSAQELNVNQILDKVKENEHIKSSVSTVRQTITTSKGSQRTLEMKSYSKDYSASQLSVYSAPARVAGDKILMLDDGDEIWFYTPKTDRVRHIASSAKKQKVQGSDFSYEDMEMWDYKADFTSKLIGSERIGGNNCYKIESVPTATGPHYSKMVFWVDKENFVTSQVDYYENGEETPFKRLLVENIQKTGQYWMPMKLTMKSLSDGGQTIVENLDIKINVELDDILFTTNSLKQK